MRKIKRFVGDRNRVFIQAQRISIKMNIYQILIDTKYQLTNQKTVNLESIRTGTTGRPEAIFPEASATQSAAP